MKTLTRYASLCLAALLALPALAEEPESCRNVRFVDIGWTDITATTALATTVFEGLGYKPSTTMASVPISLAGLKNKQIDVSLGYWSPIQNEVVQPMAQAKSLLVLEPPNLVGARETLAVPSYAADDGLKSFDDIVKFKKELDGKIYGIEPGSGANAHIQEMIDKNQFGLGGFKLVQSSEAGMLSEVTRAIRQKKKIVFLGWAPHPMNIDLKLTYLTGGEAIFGEPKVYTMVASDYLERCPNAGKLVSNLQFDTDMENQLMAPIMAKVSPAKVARDYLKKNPQVLDKWLVGVKTVDGKDGLPAVRKHLGL